MILFKQYHVQPILTDRKRTTRRTGRRRWLDLSVHQCKTSFFVDPFAHVLICKVYEQPLRDMTVRDAYLEGYDTLAEYKAVWRQLHGVWRPTLVVWVVDFARWDPDTNRLMEVTSS